VNEVNKIAFQSKVAVASPGFVARMGKDGNCHGALTMDFRAGCSSCSILMILWLIMQYWSKELWLLTSASA